MRVGLHTCKFNISEESPILPLIRKFEERGHEVVFLDTSKAQWEGDQIAFPALAAGGQLDAFVSYLPECDWDNLWHGSEAGEVPYFTQVKWLDSRFPTPYSYETQMIVNNKLLMAEVFEKAGVPIPRTYDGNDFSSREKVLADIRNEGKTFVFKPAFGGNSFGVVKIHTVEEAEKAFVDFDKTGLPFLLQEYILGPQANGACTDYRAFVVGDRVVASIKCNSRNWKRDYDAGTEEELYRFTPQQERDAVKVIQAAGLGYGSVDILNAEGQHYICEIGDNVGITDYDEVLRGHVDLAGEIVSLFEREYGDSLQRKCNAAFNVAHTDAGQKPIISQELPRQDVKRDIPPPG